MRKKSDRKKTGQTDLFAIDFNLQEGKKLRDQGIDMAVTHADKEVEAWSQQAYVLLLRYIRTVSVFLCEDFRMYCVGKLDEISENRAFGGVIRRAVKAKLIKRVGYAPMKDKKSHANPKSIWEVIK